MHVHAVVAAALVVLTATAGCARLRPSAVVDRLKTGPPPLCMDHAVVVTGAWSDRVAVVFQRLYAVAKGDLGSLRVEVVGVRATVADEHREEGFAVCRTADRAAITVFESRVLDLLRRPDSEIVMARAFAHLLAHLAIHPRPPVGDEARARAEAEADETGVFFFERAGYDCNRWENSGEYRRNVRIACNLAKQGERLHPPRRAEPSR